MIIKPSSITTNFGSKDTSDCRIICMSFLLAPDCQQWATESFGHTRHTCHQKVPLLVKISQKLCTAEQEEDKRREDKALVDYASIILGIIGAPEHQELCWHNRYMYTFLITWPRTLQTCFLIRPSPL